MDKTCEEADLELRVCIEIHSRHTPIIITDEDQDEQSTPLIDVVPSERDCASTTCT